MSLSDSMFLFELVVEELESFINYRDFSIVTQFADLFRLHLKNPNELDVNIPKRPRKKTKRKKVRDGKANTEKSTIGPKVRIGQSVLLPNNADSLMLSMRSYPLQLCLCLKSDPDYVLGSTNIPWSQPYLDYLCELSKNRDVLPITVEGKYNVFDEISSKRMATVKMFIKLSCLNDKLTTQFRSLSEDNPQTFMYTGFNSDPVTILSTIKDKQTQQDSVFHDPGIIKTIYSGGKKYKRSSKDKKPPKVNPEPAKNEVKPKCNLNRFTEIDEDVELLKQPGFRVNPETTISEKIVDFIKSATDLEVNKQIAVIKSKSSSALQYESNLNALNYIFGDRQGPYGNKVYCVGYFTVQKDSGSSKSKLSSSKSADKLEVKEKFKFKLCDSECPSRKHATDTCSSHCTLDLPADAEPLISMTKCDNVECNFKKHREPPPRPDDRVMIDMSGLKRVCCDPNVTEKVEQVVGGMTAQMKIGNDAKDPCFCSCECRFGFTKKTTYCNVCGGYEVVGDEISRIPGINMPFPCPIYHKLIDKNKRKSISASGSDTKRNDKKSEKRTNAGAESEKDNKKGKKKKKDDRFKFNYGYQGIPPQIGHSHCAMPCTGTLGNVPKRMGWLWTAEDVPGLKVAKGWKPGAISKRLLRKLQKAKMPQYTVLRSKTPLKKTKKRADNKPTLIVCKANGEYIVEMQVTGENSEGSVEQYNPLVYKIAKANNQERLEKLERRKRQLIRKAVEEVWQDPYHPEVCERTCLRAYKQAVGLLPYDPNNPSCTCEDVREQVPPSCSCDEDDISCSDCSSLDVDWEIHFTPPFANL